MIRGTQRIALIPKTTTFAVQTPSESKTQTATKSYYDHKSLNTQYRTNSTLVCPVKIEYVTKKNIFGLKMMMKSGLEKNI